MPYYSVHVEYVYNVEAEDAEEALRLYEAGTVDVADSKNTYVTDENGEEV